ncbi:MAG TPA: fatty acid desaturase [Anaerolineales bacterium]
MMKSDKTQWQLITAKYASPDLARSLWQVADSVLPFVLFFGAALWAFRLSFWLALPLCVLAAGFMIRTFIIFHDCGHGSFFKSIRANDILGFITGVLTFTPYYSWKHDHAIHHATSGDLDRRGVGDVYTMTVREYMAAPWWKRFGYRVMRNPIAMFAFGSLLVFVVVQRIPHGTGRRERASIWWTNLALACIAALLSLIFGWQAYLVVQLLVVFFGASAGIWLFYVQHNFEGVYWERHGKWDYFKASMQGSSFYKLPAVLEWFSGSIGYHHIHHLGARIPNYNLARAYRENPIFHVKPLTLLSSLKCLKWRLYDEASCRLVGWDALRNYRAQGT